MRTPLGKSLTLRGCDRIYETNWGRRKGVSCETNWNRHGGSNLTKRIVSPFMRRSSYLHTYL